MKKHFYALAVALLFNLSPTRQARAQAVNVTFTPVVATGLNQPLDIVRPPADTSRLFIVQKDGTVRIFQGGVLRADSFLNIRPLLSYSAADEQGLLSMAFHPDYAINRLFYVLYVNTAGNIALARYATSLADSNKADPTSGVVVKTVPHPGETNHNGGKIIFGTDGLLYWSTGDGGGGGDPNNNAQNGASLLGKMLRLAVNTSATPPYYTAPLTNPFIGVAGVDSLVYQFGLRNPFRWSFDRLTGDMWIADVGQGAWEEVNYAAATATAGIDWGWRCREGAHPYSASLPCGSSPTDPVFEYNHSSSGGTSITGGYVYRGTQYPALYGRYLVVDFNSDNLWTVSPNGPGFMGALQLNGAPSGIAAFGENSAGELYAVSLYGTMYSVSASGTPLPAGTALSFAHGPQGSCEAFSWNADVERASIYALEWSRDGVAYDEVARVDAPPYRYAVCGDTRRSGLYRLRIVERDGTVSYSKTLRVLFSEAETSITLAPVPLQSGEPLRVQSAEGLTSVIITDAGGRVVYRSAAALPAGRQGLVLPPLSPGLYTARCTSPSGAITVHKLSIR